MIYSQDEEWNCDKIWGENLKRLKDYGYVIASSLRKNLFPTLLRSFHCLGHMAYMWPFQAFCYHSFIQEAKADLIH